MLAGRAEARIGCGYEPARSGFLRFGWRSAPRDATSPYRRSMLALIIVLLVIWAVLAVLGFAIKGLIWLAIAGLILFVITGLIGFIRRGGRKA
jgi:hypothetical protein